MRSFGIHISISIGIGISRLNQGHKFISLWLLRATVYK